LEVRTVFSRREKMLVVAAALAVVLAVGFQLVGGPRGPSSAEQTRITGRWRAAKRRVSDLEARLAAMTSPASSAFPRLLRAAQASAVSAGVAVASARPRRPTKTASGCQENSLEIQATGSYPGVIKFISDIQAKNPSVRLARAAISSADAASDRVNSTITISSYSPGEVTK